MPQVFVAGLLELTGVAASEVVNQRRIYFNISQEGKSDVDVLREFELLNALKLSSKEHTAVTAFQISIKVNLR